jgi:hypothetical protein
MQSDWVPTLEAVQRRFYELVTAPEGVEQGLADRSLGADDLAAMVRSDPRISAVDRLNVYANMYFFRIRDVLRDDYPKLVQVLGDDEFHNLVTDYLLMCPPTDFTIRNAGERLAGFAADHRLSTDFPWLADLAGLERCRTDVFDAPDAGVLTAEQLRALPPEGFQALKVQLIPAHRILGVRFPVHEIWRALEDGKDAPDIAPSRHELLVWRRDPLIHQRPLSALEVEVRTPLVGGASLSQICELLADTRPVEGVASLGFELLAQLVQDGLIAA